MEKQPTHDYPGADPVRSLMFGCLTVPPDAREAYAAGLGAGEALRMVQPEIDRLRTALEQIAALPHSNPSGDTLHGPCPRCIAEEALRKEKP